MLQFWLELIACDVIYVAVSKSLRFHLPTLETERFQTAPFLKPFRKSSFSSASTGVLRWLINENISKSVDGAIGWGLYKYIFVSDCYVNICRFHSSPPFELPRHCRTWDATLLLQCIGSVPERLDIPENRNSWNINLSFIFFRQSGDGWGTDNYYKAANLTGHSQNRVLKLNTFPYDSKLWVLYISACSIMKLDCSLIIN